MVFDPFGRSLTEIHYELVQANTCHVSLALTNPAYDVAKCDLAKCSVYYLKKSKPLKA